MADARAARIDIAVASAGELIAALQDEGPVTPRQARVIVFAAVRAAVPNFQQWEVRKSAARIVPSLKRERLKAKDGVQLALPLEEEDDRSAG